MIPIAVTWTMHGGPGWWIAMIAMMAIFWAVIILGAVSVARGTANGSFNRRRQTPSEILDQRFAEGEISTDEYHTRRELLTGAASAHNGA